MHCERCASNVAGVSLSFVIIGWTALAASIVLELGGEDPPFPLFFRLLPVLACPAVLWWGISAAYLGSSFVVDHYLMAWYIDDQWDSLLILFYCCQASRLLL
jgi:hypothetical protein